MCSSDLAIALTLSSTEAFCNDSAGTATVVVTNGAKPYTYLWNDFLSQTASTAVGLPPGVYSLEMSDNNGCISSETITVGEIPGMSVVLNLTDATCVDNADGSIKAVVAGGTPPYNYQWEPGSGTGALFDNLLTGSYNVTVTDSNGCTNIDTIIISAQDGPECSEWKIFSGLTPNDDGVDDTWKIRGLGKFDKVSVTIISNRGIVVWKSDNYQNDWGGTDQDGMPLMEGIYYCVVSRTGKTFKRWVYISR